jgi:sarcosine oxidase gamma subunit
VIARARRTRQSGRRERGEKDPGLGRQTLLVVDVHRAGEVHSQVDHATPAERRVATGEGAEAVLKKVCAYGLSAEAPMPTGKCEAQHEH